MLSAGAYSFRQQSRLAISLSWIAGYVNVVIMLATTYMVSHTTGNTTHFTESLMEARWGVAAFTGGVLFCFFIGAAISAAMTEGTRRRGLASNFILPIATEAAMLVALGIMIRSHHDTPWQNPLAIFAMVGLGSMAMGLQNATITKISGSVIRTTHLTGVFTDMGIEAIHLFLWWKDRVRGTNIARASRLLRVMFRHPTFLRVALLASIIGSFIFGLGAGAWTYLYWPQWSMAAPVSFLLWIVLVDWFRPIADVREMDPLNDPDLHMAGIVKDLLPPQVGIYRLFWHKNKRHHRAPSFQQWVRGLPVHWHVIVLVMSPLTHIDANAAMDLRRAVEYLHDHHKRLVIANLTQAQYHTLAQAGIHRLIAQENICPDLEFAIARALALHQDLQAGHASTAQHLPQPRHSF